MKKRKKKRTPSRSTTKKKASLIERIVDTEVQELLDKVQEESPSIAGNPHETSDSEVIEKNSLGPESSVQIIVDEIQDFEKEWDEVIEEDNEFLQRSQESSFGLQEFEKGPDQVEARTYDYLESVPVPSNGQPKEPQTTPQVEPEAASEMPDVVTEAVSLASEEMKRLLEASRERSFEEFEVLVGKEALQIFDAIDRAALNPGFGGLMEVRSETAIKMASCWVAELKAQKKKGSFKEEIPQAFTCRSLPDGSLFMKAIPLPRGIVIPSDQPQISEIAAYGGFAPYEEDDPTKDLREIEIGEDGKVMVS